MKNIKVIIGANFGDEGKGLMTDYFSSQYKNGIVVRFNGGSQAGHTVITPDSIRHVFSHFGAGTLVGLPTYLSEYFIVNPMMFKKEYIGLNRKLINPKIYIDKDCLITTPYDIMINQIAEKYRDDKKHGSCGLGVNETIRRSKIINITYKDLYDLPSLEMKLFKIQKYYVNYRLTELDIDAIPIEYVDLLNNPNIIYNYLEDIKFIKQKVLIEDVNILNNYKDIIFEGSQGLLLDQDSSFFPNVTPSKTGIYNVVKILKSLNYQNENIEIIYVTRNYMTRHGAGKFPTEITSKPYNNIIDLTNIYNIYQDNIKYGLLDLDLLQQSIDKDITHAIILNHNVKIAITCLDQIDNKVKYILNGNIVESNKDEFIRIVFDKLNKHEGYLSYGATRSTIQTYANIGRD